MSLTISSSLTAGIFWLAYFASLARSDLSDISTIKYNHTGTPFDIDGNTRGYMDDLKMDKKFFFNWGKTRINLTEYLIQHNRNNSHWSNVISIDEPEDKEVFERYHDKQGEDFLDEMIRELDDKVQNDFPLKFRIVYELYGNTTNKTDRIYHSFDKMMRVRNLIVKDFEQFAERRILKLPIMQKRYFRSLFFYNCNLENINELRHYIRSYFKLEDDIDEDMKVQQKNLRKIQAAVLDAIHNQYYLDLQKELETRYLHNNMTSFDYTRPYVQNYKTKYHYDYSYRTKTTRPSITTTTATGQSIIKHTLRAGTEHIRLYTPLRAGLQDQVSLRLQLQDQVSSSIHYEQGLNTFDYTRRYVQDYKTKYHYDYSYRTKYHQAYTTSRD
ncbi:hypothetical protein M8J75_002127 [Diaphorina citri]|nr:hypothetical protein M8J75_002127 [Diaphorina citri]KAI5728953.1 hypothetical protein M8J77_023587 [Diaphorina citri]